MKCYNCLQEIPDGQEVYDIYAGQCCAKCAIELLATLLHSSQTKIKMLVHAGQELINNSYHSAGCAWHYPEFNSLTHQRSTCDCGYEASREEWRQALYKATMEPSNEEE